MITTLVVTKKAPGQGDSDEDEDWDVRDGDGDHGDGAEPAGAVVSSSQL